MKKIILTLFISVFLFSGCGTYKRIEKSEKTKKTSKKTEITKKDSIKESTKVLPTQSELSYNLDDLKKSGDFEQKVLSGNGTGSIISKKGNKITLKTRTSGSKNEKINVTKDSQKDVYNAEFVVQETNKLIKRIPFKYWLIIWFVILVSYRKFVTQLLVSVFPGLASKRLFSIFLGNNKP